jgi:hypothetical protein
MWISGARRLGIVPFPDELGRGLAVVPYDLGWPGEFMTLASRIEAALGSVAVGIDHIGSTSVPRVSSRRIASTYRFESTTSMRT